MLSILGKRWFHISCLVLVFFKACSLSFDFRYSDGEFEYLLREAPYNYKANVDYTKIGKKTIRSISIGADSLPLLVFIHGAPSSSSYFINYAKDSLVLSKMRLLLIDRPGYGFSDFGQVEKSVSIQADLISTVLEKYRNQHKVILLAGSSYGGTVSARLAMDYPKLLDGLILIQSSVAPGEETIYDISYILESPPISWLTPQIFINANREKLSHFIALKKMLPFWKKIKVPTLILHGEDDELIWLSNALFAKRKLVNSDSVFLDILPNTGHEIPYNRQAYLVKKILKSIHLAKDFSERRKVN